MITKNKGDLNGTCYRSACDNQNATWFNHSTRKHYCTSCVNMINQANRKEARELFGHDLCTEVKMGIEIERKFLVDADMWTSLKAHHYLYVTIVQGYLSLDPLRTVRVRTADNNDAFITVKGAVNNISRPEYEYPIPIKDAQDMLNICEGSLIAKRRYGCTSVNGTFTVDEFTGDNTGLVLVEVELDHEDEVIHFPYWVGEEVTHDSRYYNSNLALSPYKEWK